MRMPKKILSSVLSAALVAGLVPASPSGALAEDEPVQLGAEPVVMEADAADSPLLEVSEEDSDLNMADQTTGENIPAQDDEPALGDGIELPASTTAAQDDVLEAQAITYSQPATHTKQQIKSFIEGHPFDVASPSTYAVEPSVTSPYAPGTLSGDSTQNALNALNSLRYIAGVGYNVTNNADYQSYAQAAALVNKVNGSLSHYPSQPAGMDSTLYQRGYSGAGNSNIAYGYTNAAKSIIQYFDDLGSNNSGTAGHRRWLISSRLGQVGVGQVSNFNATYVSDSSNSSYVTDVAWPARCMPTGLIDTDAQWSFSTVTQNIGTASSISVRVVRRRDGKVWNLSSSNITVNEVSEYGYFVGYDMNGCIVWSMPDVGAYLDGDVFDVTISGNKSSKSYSVEFFDLYSVDDIKISAPDGTALQNGATHEVIISTGMQRFAFFPGFTSGTYPTQPGLQTLADDARWSQTVTYTSSNESVATVAPQASHEYYTFYNNERVMCDWLANITPKGIGTTTITATLSNGVSKSIKLVVKKKNINPDADKRAQVSSYGTLTYNGSPQHLTFYVYYNGSTLKEGRDYQITYANNTNAGTATATLTGIGDYDGTVRREFSIARANLANAAMASIGSRTYTGSAITPTLTVTMNNRSLVAGTDYDAAYAQNTNVGTASVTLTGKGNYTGTKTGSFSIVAAPISSATIAKIADQTYTGSVLKPALGVTFGGKRLVAGTDYDATYAQNTNVGTADVTLTGKGNFSGTATASFKVVAKSITPALIATIATQTYTGAAITPEPVVTLGEKTLVSGVDYFVNYINNTNAGTATVTVVGNGNYKDSKSATFTIVAAPISSATIAKIADQTYTGSALKPALGVTFGGKRLVAGTDYDATYAQNTNVGTADVTLTGKGNFSGTATASFKVVAKSITPTVSLSPTSYTYDGTAKTPTVTVKDGNKTLVKDTDYTVSYTSGRTNVGTYKATVTLKGNYAGTGTASFSIGARDLSSAKVAQIAKQTYTGAEIKPAPTVTLGNKTLVAGTDYSVTYAKNTGKGTANVTVVGKGNYKGETATTFTIDSAPISSAAIAKVGSLTYTGKALTPTPALTFGGKKLASGTDYTVAYEKNTNAGTATIRISGKGNFSGSTSTTFAIAKASIATARVQAVSSQTYLGEERRPSVAATFGESPLVEGTDYTLSYRNNVDVGTATVTLTGKGNFQGTTDVEFAVAIPFGDVTMQTGHVEDICWLYETAISQGWTTAREREFRPYANVARADMAAFLFRLAVRWDIVGNDWQPTGSASFGDVTSSTAHYREIMWLAEEGISKGWTMKDGTVEFRPYANVARADMAAFLSRLYERRFFSDVDDHEGESLLAEAQLVAMANGFIDVNSSTAHYDEIQWLAEEGISKGWTMKDGTVEFRPYANVARADMAAFLHRLNNLAE